MKNWYLSIYKGLSSPTFFWIVIGVFLFQALWLVFSAIYPMAFDEAYHFGVIQIYANQWLPFIAEHPEGADTFATVHRYPSYLFHYLLSFPYRVFALFSDNQVAQIIFLRLINVGFFTYTLILLRKLFVKSGVSPALTHVGLLFFTFIPIVPLLAAHINYDNLLILLIVWILILAVDIIKNLQEQIIDTKKLLILGVVAIFTSIVKYAALPILAAIAVFLSLYSLWVFRGYASKLLTAISNGWKQISPKFKIILPLLLLLSMGLAFERYGLNLINHEALIPACDEVLTHEQCLEFGPYERNFNYKQRIDPEFEPSILEHVSRWHSGMWYRLFFMINGDVEVDRYHNFPPLPIMAATFTALFILGLVSMITYARSIFKNRPDLLMMLIVAIFYALVLWQMNYSSYIANGRTAALNGRYLLLIIPSVIILMSLGVSKLFKSKLKLKIASVLLATLLLLQGGGVTSFIIRSSQTWYWPNETVWQINTNADKTLSPVIFGSEDQHLNFVPR
ncbi:MAG: hypothetical protein WD061_03385 [Candidatus Saccharimonadales bacterium]